jgi:nucleotide-binding universal stress UspA family protein
MPNGVILPLSVTRGDPAPTIADQAPGPILVAVDGSANSRQVIQFAAALAGSAAAPVHVVSVIEAMTTGVADLSATPAGRDQLREAEQRGAELRELVSAVAGGEECWPVDIRIGLAAQAIAAEGDALGARVIVIGAGMHRFRERVLGDETALYVARYGHTPVCTVPPGIVTPPTTGVCGIDFSDHSLRAASRAVELFPLLQALYLVHIYAPGDFPDEGAFELLGAFAERLRSTRRITVDRAALCHPVAQRGLLDFCRTVDADIVIVGAHGKGFLSRLVQGTVSGSVIRDAPMTTLIVPPSSASARESAAMIRGQEGYRR